MNLGGKMEYEIPDPEKEPIKALVLIYKLEKGFEFDDKVWDKIHFGRCMRSAKDLISVCGDYQKSKTCLQKLGEQFSNSDLSWTFETIVKHSHDFMAKNGVNRNGNVNKNRTRFHNALALKRSTGQNQIQGGIVTAGEIVNSLRVFDVIGYDDRNENGRTDTENGKAGTGI